MKVACLWEHEPVQTSVAVLTYAAMQRGNDKTTRALWIEPFWVPASVWEVEEAGPGKQKGGLRGEACRVTGPGVWAGQPSSHRKRGSNHRHSGVWVQGPASCVRSYKINRGTSESKDELSSEGRGEPFRASPFLLLGKRPFKAASAISELHLPKRQVNDMLYVLWA